MAQLDAGGARDVSRPKAAPPACIRLDLRKHLLKLRGRLAHSRRHFKLFEHRRQAQSTHGTVGAACCVCGAGGAGQVTRGKRAPDLLNGQRHTGEVRCPRDSAADPARARAPVRASRDSRPAPRD